MLLNGNSRKNYIKFYIYLYDFFFLILSRILGLTPKSLQYKKTVFCIPQSIRRKRRAEIMPSLERWLHRWWPSQYSWKHRSVTVSQQKQNGGAGTETIHWFYVCFRIGQMWVNKLWICLRSGQNVARCGVIRSLLSDGYNTNKKPPQWSYLKGTWLYIFEKIICFKENISAISCVDFCKDYCKATSLCRWSKLQLHASFLTNQKEIALLLSSCGYTGFQ